MGWPGIHVFKAPFAKELLYANPSVHTIFHITTPQVKKSSEIQRSTFKVVTSENKSVLRYKEGP